ncbi:uncharacterized protein LOC144362070 [Saccoglossus kowalevskii]
MAKPSKCYIGFTQLEFLGHVVGRGQLSLVPGKVRALQNAPRPLTVTNVMSFVGLAGYYRKFVPNFAAIAAPLHELTKKGKPRKVEWEPCHQLAFEQLKNILSNAPVLRTSRF